MASNAAPKVREVDVAIMGGGLAGCLLAVYLARDGYSVDVYERRQDFRSGKYTGGKSINLALSARGLAALAEVGLDKEIRETGIAMYGRRLHSLQGSTTFQPYGQKDQYNLSVVRQTLNDRLLSAAEKNPKVKLFFEHKCLRLDLEKGTGDVQNIVTGEQFRVVAKLFVGADGAFSAVRNSMQRQLGFNYSQQFLDHDYKELCIPPTADGQFALADTNSLHIWPRGDFMMIALPNQDKSWTCTIFMPSQNFAEIQTDEQVLAFMNKHFPDAVPLMPTLLQDWKQNPASKLVMVSCSPIYYKDKAVLVGDAAHAMVPFFGQGMNASLQDVQVLAATLRREKGDFGKALAAFHREHKPDMDAICSLSYQNYAVMRSHVNSRLFLMRKRVELWLNWLMPHTFMPLYTMVSFNTIPYSEVVRRAQRQEKILDRVMLGFGFTLGTAAILGAIGAIRPELLRDAWARVRGHSKL